MSFQQKGEAMIIQKADLFKDQSQETMNEITKIIHGFLALVALLIVVTLLSVGKTLLSGLKPSLHYSVGFLPIFFLPTLPPFLILVLAILVNHHSKVLKITLRSLLFFLWLLYGEVLPQYPFFQPSLATALVFFKFLFIFLDLGKYKILPSYLELNLFCVMFTLTYNNFSIFFVSRFHENALFMRYFLISV